MGAPGGDPTQAGEGCQLGHGGRLRTCPTGLLGRGRSRGQVLLGGGGAGEGKPTHTLPEGRSEPCRCGGPCGLCGHDWTPRPPTVTHVQTGWTRLQQHITHNSAPCAPWARVCLLPVCTGDAEEDREGGTLASPASRPPGLGVVRLTGAD